RKPELSPARIQEVVEATLHTTPAGATHWTVRTMAKARGLGPTTIHRIWRQHGLQPHRVETFKLSRDPRFVEKLRDVVGLYLDPPEHALVLSVDEKSQIQALDRTAPLLPLRHPRFHFHFTPTSSSWLNLVERWFRDLSQKRIRRGSFDSVDALITAIEEYLATYNVNPTRFTWTKDADMILAKINRCKAALG